MLDVFGIQHEIDYLDVFIYVIVAVTIFIVKLFFKDFFENRGQKRKQTKFINFLKTNKSIDNQIKQYGKIGFFSRQYAIYFTYMGMALAPVMSFSPLITMLYLYKGNITDDIVLKLYLLSTTISLLVAFILIVFIKEYINSKDSFKNPCKILKSLTAISNGYLTIRNWLPSKSKSSIIDGSILLDLYVSYANIFTLVNFYIIFTYTIIISQFYHTLILNSNRILNLGAPYAVIFIFNLVLLTTIPIGAITQNQDYKNSLKNILNSKGSRSFPHLHVRTKENIQIDGIIMDIFDNKFLILENNGVKKITLWDSVSTLEISEGEVVDTIYQKKLQDYFG